MELEEEALDLGLDFPWDGADNVDAVISDAGQSPFGSGSDYSSEVLDGNNSILLFPDVSLYNAIDRTDVSNSDHSYEASDRVILQAEADSVTLPNGFITTTESSTVKSISRNLIKLEENAKNVTSETPNQHDYALPSDAPVKNNMISKESNVLTSYFSSKNFIRSESEKKAPAPASFKMVTPPSSPEEPKENSALNYSHMTKNAIAARENRLKKKKYIETLENSVQGLKSENQDLKTKVEEMSSSVSEMSKELEYMRSILSNVEEISYLVKGIKTLPKYQSGKGQKRCHEEKTVSNVVTKFPKNAKSCSLPFKAFSGSNESSKGKPGICVHVRGSAISLELCHHCSEKAVSTLS